MKRNVMNNRETSRTEFNRNSLYYDYSVAGKGSTLIFIHGAFADSEMFNPQWDYFVDKFPILRFDLRGHGKTGATQLDPYKMETFMDDLAGLMDDLDIHAAILCGVSWGGSIAQGFATKYPGRVKGLVLAGSMVSMSLTFWEKIQRYVLFPKWLMQLLIQSMSVENFIKLTFKLSDIFIGKDFLSGERYVFDYLKNKMMQMDSLEYRKIWGAIYDFDMFPLEKIIFPTLILNGEFESKKVKRHSQELLKKIPNSSLKVIPDAKHAINMENPKVFNQMIDDFLQKIIRE